MPTKFAYVSFLSLTLLAGLACPSFSHSLEAGMASTNYRVDWDTISSGGSDTGSSASFMLQDTIGNPAIGAGFSVSYELRAGYRQGIDNQVLSFAIAPQVTSSLVEASAKSGNTITVASTTDFSAGDLAAVVQNIGEDQVSAVGRIQSKSSTTLVFDDLADNGTAPVIDGTNDGVFLLESDSLDLDTISRSALTTALIGLEVTALSNNGYTVQVSADGDLRDGSEEIDSVTDGSVTAGSEEYGAISSDTSITTSTFDTEDTAISASLQAVATVSTGPDYDDRHFLTLKAAASDTTEAGDYTQTLTFVVTGNY